ncbi:hypothetical protein D3C71_1815690 [compost metagenome]
MGRSVGEKASRASANRASRDFHRRYSEALPAPIRLATASIVSEWKPPSATCANAARIIRKSNSASRGRPTAGLAVSGAKVGASEGVIFDIIMILDSFDTESYRKLTTTSTENSHERISHLRKTLDGACAKNSCR